MNRAVKTKSEVIKVNLRWFSQLAELRGVRSETITLQAGTTGEELINHLAEDFEELNRMKKHVRLALNQSYTGTDCVIRDGDEVAFITPVSGG